MGAGADDVAIERLNGADAGEILTLQRAAYVSEARLHDDLELPPLVQTVAELDAELAMPSVHAFGIRRHSRLVAAMRIHLDGEVAEIGRLVVAPDLQGHGLGTTMLAGVDGLLPAQVTRVELFTGERSLANLRLYQRMGFGEVRRVAAGEYEIVYLARSVLR